MLKEEITLFLNKKVKLIKGNDFALTGKITQINETSIIFETTQATSIISLDSIKEIILPREGNHETH